jgi:hypothetical protein
VTDSLEHAAVEVFQALTNERLEAILLKGPTVATWLYSDPADRPYGDLDLLVAPTRVPEVERLLEGNGFEGHFFVGERGAPSSRIWTRRTDDASVDLQDRVVGIDLAAEDAWQVLWEATEPLALSAGRVTALQPQARALMVALAAADKGAAGSKTLGDLSAALERLPLDAWRHAYALADRLEATPAFAAGLCLLRAGADVAESRQLPSSAPVDIRLRAEAPPDARAGALAIAWIAEQRTWSGRLTAVARVLVPSPAAMKEAFPNARRGPVALIAAYAWRLAILGPRKIAPAGRAYLAARRRSR